MYTSSPSPPVPPCLTRLDAECATGEFTRIYTGQNRVRITGCNMACVRHSFRCI